MGYEFQPGDLVRIRHDAISKVGSERAATDWGPNRSVLTVRRPSNTAIGCFVVRGPYPIGFSKVDQTVFGGFLELVEKAEPQGDKTCRLSDLKQGARFWNRDCNLTMIKTDEVTALGLIKSVTLEGVFSGVLSSIDGSTLVTPLEGHEPDPWEQAKVYYGDLVPGDLFRTDRGDSSDRVCVVVNKTDSLGDYHMMRNGVVSNAFGRSREVYRDDVLVEHGV